MEIFHEQIGDIDCLTLKGRFDSAHAKQFKKEMNALTEQKRVNLIIDMNGVDFIDSAGLGALLSSLRTVNHLGGDIKIASLQPQSRAIFELTRLHRVFSIFNDLAEAQKSFTING